MWVNNSFDKQDANGTQQERPGILGGLAQRLQGGVRATLDAFGQGHAQQLAAIIESSDDGIYSQDLNGIIVTWNEGAERLYGYAADEVVGRSITVLLPPELLAEETEILGRIKRAERIEHYETIRQRKDGRRIQVALTVSPILDAAGQVIGASKVARDITSRKRAADTQTALYTFTDRLFRAGSADDIYQAALDAIVGALGCDRASILLFDDTGIMKFAAWRGLSDQYRQAVEGHSPWTRETSDPQPITVGDIRTAELDASLKATVEAEGIVALAFIPLMAKGELIGKFMTYYPVPHDFIEADIKAAVTISRQLGFGLERMRAEEQRQSAEAANQLLLNESRHRIKNTLATVQAIASQTLRRADPDDLRTFLARLHALGEAHELLTTESWHRASLKEVVDRALKPFVSKQENRFAADGASVWLPANTSLSLTLCLHELGTNAVKYGAFSNGTGRVQVSWDVVGDAERRRLRLTWQEQDGPTVHAPQRKGFGSLLIQSTGEAETCIDFRPDGVRCVLDLSL